MGSSLLSMGYVFFRFLVAVYKDCKAYSTLLPKPQRYLSYTYFNYFWVSPWVHQVLRLVHTACGEFLGHPFCVTTNHKSRPPGGAAIYLSQRLRPLERGKQKGRRGGDWWGF
jgi:hypothetical protein